MEILYENIKKRRRELGMTQAELASKLGYKDHTTVNAIEHGKVDISVGRAKQFAAALDVSFGWLLGLEGKS